MGWLQDGIWQVGNANRPSKSGAFQRAETQFRNWITADGSPGPTGEGGFPAEAGRYHIYWAHACPWAHRTIMVRALKGLEDTISVAAVLPDMLEMGWTFPEGGDPLYGLGHVHQIYQKANPRYTGRCSVPVLWDKQRETIVNNESSEIVRMLDSAFAAFDNGSPSLYPADLRAEIDAINEAVYANINNGVYRSGFATSQAAYEAAFDALFATLDDLEQRLAGQRYLTGNRITEADWRLFATLIRFDAVYHNHFRCNRAKLAELPNLSNYTRELYQLPGIAETVDIARIKQHYYGSHIGLNPTRIVPKGPAQDFGAAHDRDRFAAAA